MTSDAVVYLVDDDPAVLKSMHWLVESANFSARPLTSAGMSSTNMTRTDRLLDPRCACR